MAAIWAWLEPTIVLLQLIFGMRFRFYSKMTEKQVDGELDRCYESVCEYLNLYGVHGYYPSPKEVYLRQIKSDLIRRRNFFVFLDGEIHHKLLKEAILPKEKRINAFLTISFFFVNGYKVFFNYLLFIEKLRRIFRRKYTFLHYLSISNWKIKNYNDLVNDVQNIEKIDPLWNQKYLLPKGVDIKENRPTIARAIDIVLSKGVISERSIFNLATSEKLIFIHKYAEGFSKTWRQQDSERERLQIEKEKWKKSKAKDAVHRLRKINDSITELNNNWLLAPIRYALEHLGFQKLFNNLEGVYVLPLSLLPEQYHKDPEQFIKDRVITKAEEYLDSIDINKFDYIDDINESLKYLILLHVIPVNQLKIISKERNIEISSPELSRMLFSTYLSSDSSNLSNLYINDVVRNVDFKTQLKDNKTGNYILTNLEFLQTQLWRQYHIDIYKPQSLSALIPIGISEICDILIEHDASVAKWRIVKQISEIVEFYQQLNQELNEIRI